MIDRVKENLLSKAKVKQKRDKVKVAASVGRLFQKYKIEKFFDWEVDETGGFKWSLKKEVIEKEMALDGCYIIRSDVSQEKLSAKEIVETYRNLQKVEQAFRNLKTVLLELRPLYHKTDYRIKSHIFIASLAYYIL